MWKFQNTQNTARAIVTDAAFAFVVALIVTLILASLSFAGVITMALAQILLVLAWLVGLIGSFLCGDVWRPSHFHRGAFLIILGTLLGGVYLYEIDHQPSNLNDDLTASFNVPNPAAIGTSSMEIDYILHNNGQKSLLIEGFGAVEVTVPYTVGDMAGLQRAMSPCNNQQSAVAFGGVQDSLDLPYALLDQYLTPDSAYINSTKIAAYSYKMDPGETVVIKAHYTSKPANLSLGQSTWITMCPVIQVYLPEGTQATVICPGYARNIEYVWGSVGEGILVSDGLYRILPQLPGSTACPLVHPPTNLPDLSPPNQAPPESLPEK